MSKQEPLEEFIPKPKHPSEIPEENFAAKVKKERARRKYLSKNKLILAEQQRLAEQKAKRRDYNRNRQRPKPLTKEERARLEQIVADQSASAALLSMEVMPVLKAERNNFLDDLMSKFGGRK